jgi:hypothetical protein
MNWPHREPDTMIVTEMLGPYRGKVFSVNGGSVFETDVDQLINSQYSDLERVIEVPDPWFVRGDMVTFVGDEDPMVVLRDMSLQKVVVVRDVQSREFTLPSDKLTLIGKVPTESPSVYIEDSGNAFFVLKVDYGDWTVQVFDNRSSLVEFFTLEDFAALDIHKQYP